MYAIRSLTEAPEALPSCITWCAREWGNSAGYSRQDWAREFSRIARDPVDEVFLAFDGDKPVGMVWTVESEGLESHPHLTPWLSSLVVDPDYRDRGVGAVLVAWAEDHFARGGDEALYCLTEVPAFYLLLGWEVHDTAQLGRKNVFIMQKPLREMALAG